MKPNRSPQECAIALVKNYRKKRARVLKQSEEKMAKVRDRDSCLYKALLIKTVYSKAIRNTTEELQQTIEQNCPGISFDSC